MARLLACLAIIALGAVAGAQSDAAPAEAVQPAEAGGAAADPVPPPAKDVKIAWEQVGTAALLGLGLPVDSPGVDGRTVTTQTPETLTFSFNTTGTAWLQFFYNTTLRCGSARTCSTQGSKTFRIPMLTQPSPFLAHTLHLATMSSIATHLAWRGKKEGLDMCRHVAAGGG